MHILPKLILILVWIYATDAKTCEQVVEKNQCWIRRFKLQCPKECPDTNGNNGNPNGNNGNNGNPNGNNGNPNGNNGNPNGNNGNHNGNGNNGNTGVVANGNDVVTPQTTIKVNTVITQHQDTVTPPTTVKVNTETSQSNNNGVGNGNGNGAVTSKGFTGTTRQHHGSSEEKNGQNEEARKTKKKDNKLVNAETQTDVQVNQQHNTDDHTNQHTTIKVTEKTNNGNHNGHTGSTQAAYANNQVEGDRHSNENHDQHKGHSNENHDQHKGHSNENSNEHSSKATTHKHTTKATTKHSANQSPKKNCNKVEPCVDQGTADAGFRKRCQAAGIKDTCLDKCRYDVGFDELKKAMLSKLCPMDQMREFIKCGANGQDNRMCCQTTGVTEGKRGFCYPFCNPSGQDWPEANQAMKYMPCASQLNAIMRCHWAGLTE